MCKKEFCLSLVMDNSVFAYSLDFLQLSPLDQYLIYYPDKLSQQKAHLDVVICNDLKHNQPGSEKT